MEVSALADIVLSLALIGVVWLAGALLIKATDYIEMRSVAAKARSRGRPTRARAEPPGQT